MFGLGHAYCLTGQYEEAIKWSEKAVHQDPDSIIARLNMTVVYSMSGREEEARIEAAEVLRIDPKYSASANERRAASVDKDKYFEALRKAGLK